MPNQQSIGLDIGATKMAFVVADETGAIYARKILPTHREHPAAATLDRVAAVLNEYLQQFVDVYGIGIGVPGPVDSQNGIAINAVNLNWQQVEVRREIAARLTRPLPIHLDNDVNAGAIGELCFGAAIGVNNYVYLTAGTGFGGAAIMRWPAASRGDPLGNGNRSRVHRSRIWQTMQLRFARMPGNLHFGHGNRGNCRTTHLRFSALTTGCKRPFDPQHHSLGREKRLARPRRYGRSSGRLGHCLCLVYQPLQS